MEKSDFDNSLTTFRIFYFEYFVTLCDETVNTMHWSIGNHSRLLGNKQTNKISTNFLKPKGHQTRVVAFGIMF